MKVVAQNRRARFDFEIIETVEAGLILTGSEVKSCRKGHINLAGAYVSSRSGMPVLKNASIARYAFTGPSVPHEELRDRALLLSKTELQKLERLTEEKGMTVVPLEVHAGKYIKVLLGVARGRKKIDKRHVIRAREEGRKLREGREL